MPINVNNPAYVEAEKEYYQSETLEQKIVALKKMISYMPSHKGAENLRAQLRTRYKKLNEQLIKSKKLGKSTQIGIKKQGHQITIIGKTNSGKSCLLNLLTNTNPKISEIQFTTIKPIIGIMNIETIGIQLIENPAITSEYYDKGLTNSADALIILINKIEEIIEIESNLEKVSSKKIIVFNYKENLNNNQLRKLESRLNSKKYNFILINLKNPKNEEIHKLKDKIFQTFDKIRVYTKEPNQKQKSPKPIILKQESKVKDAAERILKGFSEKIKQTKIWGPSSKFPGQIVGLNHKLKDLDIIEFKTK